MQFKFNVIALGRAIIMSFPVLAPYPHIKTVFVTLRLQMFLKVLFSSVPLFQIQYISCSNLQLSLLCS